MPRGVKIGTTIVLAISALVLIWSLYHNLFLVTSGWAASLKTEVVGELRDTRVVYELEIVSHDGERKSFTLPYIDVAGMQPGDRVQVRTKKNNERLVRSRRPNLAEIVALADRIVHVKVLDTASSNEKPPVAEAELLQTIKPTVNDSTSLPPDTEGQKTQTGQPEDKFTFSIVVPWLQKGDAAMMLDVQPGEEVLLFLDQRGEVFGGAAGIIKLDAAEANVIDVELSLNLPKNTLIEDVQRMVENLKLNVQPR